MARHRCGIQHCSQAILQDTPNQIDLDHAERKQLRTVVSYSKHNLERSTKLMYPTPGLNRPKSEYPHLRKRLCMS